jgi:hypothetical protein
VIHSPAQLDAQRAESLERLQAMTGAGARL